MTRPRPQTMSFEDAVAGIKEALKRHHLAVSSPKSTCVRPFSRDLAVDFRPYLILSVCSPQLAHRAIQAE